MDIEYYLTNIRHSYQRYVSRSKYLQLGATALRTSRTGLS